MPGVWRRVTACRFFKWRMATRPVSDEGDVCAAESRGVRSFEWWWRCSDLRSVAKIPMKEVSLFAMYSTFDSSGHTRILTAAAQQYRRWLRQWKNARKDEDYTKHLEQWL
uniref:Uncharacterized protein n=1 Tax=Fagus sylvatica TaxID=28930 RepID=A0A2N9G0Y3_FAGSY